MCSFVSSYLSDLDRALGRLSGTGVNSGNGVIQYPARDSSDNSNTMLLFIVMILVGIASLTLGRT